MDTPRPGTRLHYRLRRSSEVALGRFVRSVRHEEFAQTKNAWRLFNAYTEVLKGSSLFKRPRQTQPLHAMLDDACGLAA